MTIMRFISAITVAAALAAPGMAGAQKLEQLKLPDPGDKIQFNWVLNGKAQPMEEEWLGVEGDGAVGVQRVGGKEFKLVVPKAGAVSEGICLANGQPCTFSPAVTVIDVPLEKGRKWQQTFAVKGETFTVDVEAEWQVDELERIKTAAGEFEAFRVSHKGRIKGKDAKGASFSGKEDGRYWIATVNGKAFVARTEYRNSFGEKFTREATSVALK
jgi:hypothetical protein